MPINMSRSHCVLGIDMTDIWVCVKIVKFQWCPDKIPMDHHPQVEWLFLGIPSRRVAI